MRKIVLGTAAVLAAVFVYLGFTLPPRPVVTAGEIEPAIAARTVAGAFHVHSTVSDGVDSRDEIAAAAAAAGLRFVIFADHGDGTRQQIPPTYANGVLCLDGVEISTNGGHYVALDMRPSPYPLGGEAAAVIEDVRRLGGFGIAAHPYSPRPELRWRDWTAPFDGLEWLNADSEWRDEPKRSLFRLPFDYLLRPGPAMAAILDRPTAALRRWDEITSRRPAVALPAHDAHGGLAGRGEEGAGIGLPGFPSYRASFSAFSLHVVLAEPLTGFAPDDGRAVMDAVRRGRAFSAVDGIAKPARLDFHARLGTTEVLMGEALPFDPEVELVAQASIPPGGRLTLICNGSQVAEVGSGPLRYRPDAPAACRPEVSAPSAPGVPPVPWIVGNPIYLLSAVIEPIGSEPLFETSSSVAGNWVVEKEAGSAGRLEVRDGTMTLDYQLRDGARVSQYVAAAAPLTPPVPDFDRILFTGSAAAPIRVSVQLRFADSRRWVSSVYLEPDGRRAIVPLSSLVPAEPGRAERPDFRQATSILFVVDLTNARPGERGTIRISDLVFAR
jgi:hypothetical protein